LAKKRRRDDGPWAREAAEIYGTSCLACGHHGYVEFDHIIPRSQGGPSDVRNAAPLCGQFCPFCRQQSSTPCHLRKTAGDLKYAPEWLTFDQLEFLEAMGWVDFDIHGEPTGRGFKHFERMSFPAIRAGQQGRVADPWQ